MKTIKYLGFGRLFCLLFVSALVGSVGGRNLAVSPSASDGVTIPSGVVRISSPVPGDGGPPMKEVCLA